MTDDDAWILAYTDYNPAQQPLREALCTLGNGNFATRGAAEEASAGDVDYPGTYLAGGYNRRRSEVAGHTVENEDLVNFPNWLPLDFRPAGGEWLNLRGMQVRDYRQTLDLRRGVLSRAFTVQDHEGRETSLESERFVSMHRPWLAGIRWRLTPRNWSGKLEISSALDGSVINSGVERYRALNSKHLTVTDSGETADGMLHLGAETNQSQIRVAQMARTRLSIGGIPTNAERTLQCTPEAATERFLLDIGQDQTLSVEKLVVFVHSRQPAIGNCAEDAQRAAQSLVDFDYHLQRHERAWAHLWERYDIHIDHTAVDIQRLLRLHSFHLLQTVSMHSVDLDVGVPARGLHGEAYRGHIFWDSLFILSFFNFRIPQISRSLLLYRYRRLDAARWNARDRGFKGALFPWQSGSSGREESQRLHLNPRSGQWGPDHSHLQYHVNLAIAFNIWRYFQVTDDVDFMNVYGDEMFLEIARFWAGIAQFNSGTGRYDIRGVMGPDEYHEQYPDAERPGIDNNAYTNVMAAWTLLRAIEILQLRTPARRRQLLERLEIAGDEVERWLEISKKLAVPIREDGIIEQFEGYDRLQEFDWDTYRRKYGDIQRLDRILRAEGDSPDRYKVSKQCDVLMLFYLFANADVIDLFTHLGYSLDEGTIGRTIDYYYMRTSHGSTLSHVVHASVLQRGDPSLAWDQFCRVLHSDVGDIQGGTTAEGIHLGAMAGSVDIVFRHFLGARILEQGLELQPNPPPTLPYLEVKLRYRGNVYIIKAEPSGFSIIADANHPRTIHARGSQLQLQPGDALQFAAGECLLLPAQDHRR